MKAAFSVLLSLVMALAATCCAPMRSARDVSPARLEQLDQVTVALLVEDETHDYRVQCTGVWMDEHTIVTAYHCVEDAGMSDEQKALLELGLIDSPSPLGQPVPFETFDVLRSQYDGHAHSCEWGKVAAVDKPHDLALVSIASPPVHLSTSVASHALQAGDVGHIVGHTAGLLFSYSAGHVGAVREMHVAHFNGDVFQIWGAASWHGNSGGGLFDDAGDLQGIASFHIDVSGLSFFIHSEYVRDLLKKI